VIALGYPEQQQTRAKIRRPPEETWSYNRYR